MNLLNYHKTYKRLVKLFGRKNVNFLFYEEMLFRVILIYMISSILGFIFQWGKSLKQWIAMLIAAGIFSSFHFIGDYGDYFSFDIFMVRLIAGIVLGILYFARGFGIVAWTHSIYDLIIVTRITTQ